MMDSKEFDIKVRRLCEALLDSGFSRDEVGQHLQSLSDEYREPDD